MRTAGARTCYPLSPMQQGMMLHSLHSPQSGVNIQQIIAGCPDPLEPEHFRQAWQAVAQRHEVLRTSFRWEGGEPPTQEVHPHAIVPVEHLDWRQRSPTQRDLELSRFLKADRQRGFDLAQPPLVRVTVLLDEPGRSRFIWTLHHAILDGRSFPLVLQEVFAFYDALQQRQSLALPPPRAYKDFVDWLARQDVVAAEPFWRTYLRGFTTPTPLPMDRQRRDAFDLGDDYDHQSLRLSRAITAALQEMVRRNDLSLFTLVQGAWAMLLARYSGEEDVVFGVARAGRRTGVAGTEAMVGLFMNTLPARIGVEPDLLLVPWLKRLRSEQAALRPYEHTPLARIQQWSDVPPGTDLFDTILVFDHASLNDTLQGLGGAWTGRSFEMLGQTNYPLTFYAYGGSELLLKMEYDKRFYDAALVGRMLAHLGVLLEGMAAQPEQRVGALPMLTAAERRQLIVEWNDTASASAADQCIHQVIEAQAETKRHRETL